MSVVVYFDRLSQDARDIRCCWRTGKRGIFRFENAHVVARRDEHLAVLQPQCEAPPYSLVNITRQHGAQGFLADCNHLNQYNSGEEEDRSGELSRAQLSLARCGLSIGLTPLKGRACLVHKQL